MENTRHKIVLVDDNEATLDQGKSLLQSHYKVYTVQSAALLFEFLKKVIPDLILLDIEMPEMDGFETISKLKANAEYKDIPVIFLTAKSDEENERRGFQLGAVDYISKPFSGPLLQKRISNQILYMRVQNAVEDYSNNLEIMTDEIAKANERARVLFDKMPLCCRLVNKEYKMIDCNEAAVKLFGFNSKEDCKNRFYEVYPEYQPDGRDSTEKAKSLFNEAIEKGEVVFDWMYQLSDGTPLPAEVTMVRIENEGDYAIAVYTYDLREHEAVINEMRRAELAEMANTAKTQFLATMSHELRTPMNSVTGFAELALDMHEEEVPPKIRNYLLKILDSSRWFIRIVNDILDISRIESGKIELETRPFELHDIFSRCQSVIMPEATEKGLDYHVYLEPLVGVNLIGDPMRLYQILINLLSNAVKFTQKGSVKLSAAIKKSENKQVEIYFEVKDTGIGIEPHVVEEIFKPFAQADSSTTRNYGGTGLGLAITKNIIELMGGELSVQTTPGAGSKFSFELTFETVDASYGSADSIITEPVEKPTFDAYALVCDDNALNREVVCEHLARVGIKTDIATNGEEAIEKVRKRLEKKQKPFDLIFMDIFMPVKDGIEAACEINALGTRSPIVAMTANVMASEIKKYKEHGMPECLNKPFTVQELWVLLHKYLVPIKIVTNKDNKQNESFNTRIRANFAADNGDLFKNIKKCLDDGDLKQAHRLVHSLKANAGHIGEPQLHRTAELYENLLKDGIIPDDEQTEQLGKVLAGVLEKLKPLDAGKTTTAVLSMEQMHELFEKLEPLIKKKDTACEDLLNDIRAVPGAALLVRQIEEYDFKLAEHTLNELKKHYSLQ